MGSHDRPKGFSALASDDQGNVWAGGSNGLIYHFTGNTCKGTI